MYLFIFLGRHFLDWYYFRFQGSCADCRPGGGWGISQNVHLFKTGRSILRVASYELQVRVASCELRVDMCELRVENASSNLRVDKCELRVSHICELN